jgi:hypothetical protein
MRKILGQQVSATVCALAELVAKSKSKSQSLLAFTLVNMLIKFETLV